MCVIVWLWIIFYFIVLITLWLQGKHKEFWLVCALANIGWALFVFTPLAIIWNGGIGIYSLYRWWKSGGEDDKKKLAAKLSGYKARAIFAKMGVAPSGA